MNAQERDAAYLWDMHAAATNIQEFIRGINYDRFTNDKIIRYAVERQLEIIGEAAKRISVEFQKAHPEIPWQKMVALRNILAHEYGEIRLDRIWAICIGNIPELRDQLESLIPPIDDNGG